MVPDVVAINTQEVLLIGQADQKLAIKCKEQDRLVIDNVETDVRAITKVRLPRHLSCTLSSQSFTLKTDITQKERLKPIQLEFAVGEVIKQKDMLTEETCKFKIVFKICSEMHGPVVKLANLRAMQC